jgi:GNAT superfamily N-acetyltransferase
VADASFYHVRHGGPNDHAYVVDSWYQSHGASANGEDHGPNFVTEQKALIRRILARPTTELRVACDADDSDAIHGYAVLEPPFGIQRGMGLPPVALARLYYVYVKGVSRRLGIAKALLADVAKGPCIYTHKPRRALLKMLPKPPSQWTYSYFANFEEKPLDETYGKKARP